MPWVINVVWRLSAPRRRSNLIFFEIPRALLLEFSLVTFVGVDFGVFLPSQAGSKAAMETEHWVHDERIYGPVSYSGFFIQEGRIYGPTGETHFRLEDGRIVGPDGGIQAGFLRFRRRGRAVGQVDDVVFGMLRALGDPERIARRSLLPGAAAEHHEQAKENDAYHDHYYEIFEADGDTQIVPCTRVARWTSLAWPWCRLQISLSRARSQVQSSRAHRPA